METPLLPPTTLPEAIQSVSQPASKAAIFMWKFSFFFCLHTQPVRERKKVAKPEELPRREKELKLPGEEEDEVKKKICKSS